MAFQEQQGNVKKRNKCVGEAGVIGEKLISTN